MPDAYVYEQNDRAMGTPHELHVMRDGVRIATLQWSRRTGLILDVQVDQAYRRQGVATALLGEARRLAEATRGIKRPRLSGQRTSDGEAFARSLGERLPRRT